MSFCPKCGAELPKSGKFCVECGFDTEQFYRTPSDAEFNNPSPVTTNPQGYSPQVNMPPYDSGSFGWAVLGFFIPIVGLVLWLVWMNEKPKSAKMAGMGALVSVAAAVVLNVLAFFVGCSMIAALA